MSESNPHWVTQRIFALSQQLDEAMDYDWGRARELADQELGELRMLEEERQSRVHKGHALYNLGVIEFPKDPIRARRYFHAAYAEDARTEARPSRGLAARVLRELYREPWHLLSFLTRLARSSAADPEEVAADLEQRRTLPDLPFSIPPPGTRDEGEIAGDPARRVFIGGNYRRSLPAIYNARELVESVGLDPVIVREFKDSAERSRNKSFRILDRCGSAIFDGSASGGWTSEIEHLAATNSKIPVLVVYSAADRNAPAPSDMTPGLADLADIAYRPYGTPGDMLFIVLAWLLDRGLVPQTAPGRHTRTLESGLLKGSNTRMVSQPSGTQMVPGEFLRESRREGDLKMPFIFRERDNADRRDDSR